MRGRRELHRSSTVVVMARTALVKAIPRILTYASTFLPADLQTGHSDGVPCLESIASIVSRISECVWLIRNHDCLRRVSITMDDFLAEDCASACSIIAPRKPRAPDEVGDNLAMVRAKDSFEDVGKRHYSGSRSTKELFAGALACTHFRKTLSYDLDPEGSPSPFPARAGESRPTPRAPMPLRSFLSFFRSAHSSSKRPADSQC